jgi:hypothetical protein
MSNTSAIHRSISYSDGLSGITLMSAPSQSEQGETDMQADKGVSLSDR